jgi:hypothetical protein
MVQLSGGVDEKQTNGIRLLVRGTSLVIVFDSFQILMVKRTEKPESLPVLCQDGVDKLNFVGWFGTQSGPQNLVSPDR